MKNIEFKERFIEYINNRDSYNQNDLTDAEWSFADTSNLLLKEKIEQLKLYVSGINFQYVKSKTNLIL